MDATTPPSLTPRTADAKPRTKPGETLDAAPPPSLSATLPAVDSRDANEPPASGPLSRWEAEVEAFRDECFAAWRRLFSAARARNELAFAFSLSPEFRGMQDAGWNTAFDALAGVHDYLDVIARLEWGRPRVRVCLALYNHIFEASGLYEVPKNLMNVIETGYLRVQPFSHLVRQDRARGQAIAPNAKAIMHEVLGQAERLGFGELQDIISSSFNADIRHGYAHADYVIVDDGVRFPRRNGGQALFVSKTDFVRLLNRALSLIGTLEDTLNDSVRAFAEPAKGTASLNPVDPALSYTITFDADAGSLSIRGI